VVSIDTKPPLIHVVEALHKGSDTKALAKPLGHLDVVSTKELLHQGRGSPHPLRTSVLAAPNQVGGSKTCRRVTKASRLLTPLVQLDPLKNHLTRLAHLALTQL
jgi:hypothetical protein